MAFRLGFARRLARGAAVLGGGAAAAFAASTAYSHAESLGSSETKSVVEMMSGLVARLDRIEIG